MDSQANLNQEIGHLLHKTVALIDKTADRSLRAHADISLSQFLVLLSIDKHAGLHISQQTIAEHLGIDKAAISRHIDELEQRQLVQRMAHPNSGRTRVLRLTIFGEKTLRLAQQTMQETMTQHYMAAGKKQATGLVESLRQMITSLEQKGGTDGNNIRD